MFEDEGGATSHKPQAKGYRGPLEAEKDEETDFLLRASRRKQPCRHLDFSSVNPMLEF